VKRKILIVDDDADQRKILNVLLRSTGYDTAIAADAISGVTVARRRRRT
jgi:CheY-like chemotaxis protein